MHVRKMIASFVLLAALSAVAGTDSDTSTEVSVCRTQEDAEAIVGVATDDIESGRILYTLLAIQNRCGTYKGPFVIDEVLDEDDSSWIGKITTPHSGDLYLFIVLPAAPPKQSV